MDLNKVLTQLREELANLDAAIVSLERLQHEGRRRGRPPKALADARRGDADSDLRPVSGDTTRP